MSNCIMGATPMTAYISDNPNINFDERWVKNCRTLLNRSACTCTIFSFYYHNYHLHQIIQNLPQRTTLTILSSTKLLCIPSTIILLSIIISPSFYSKKLSLGSRLRSYTIRLIPNYDSSDLIFSLVTGCT